MTTKLPAVFIATSQSYSWHTQNDQQILSASPNAKECAVSAILSMGEDTKFELSKWVNGKCEHSWNVSRYGSGWNMYDSDSFDAHLSELTPEQWANL